MLLWASYGFATDLTVQQHLDYGTVLVSSSTSSASLTFDTSGNLTNSTNAQANNVSRAVANFTRTSGSNSSYRASMSNLTRLTGPGSCRITVGSSTVSPTSFRPMTNVAYPIYYLLRTINIPANCTAGTYTATATMTVRRFGGGGGSSSYTATINVTLFLAFPNTIEINNNQDLNFGTMISTTAHNVTIDYNGNRSGNASY